MTQTETKSSRQSKQVAARKRRNASAKLKTRQQTLEEKRQEDLAEARAVRRTCTELAKTLIKANKGLAHDIAIRIIDSFVYIGPDPYEKTSRTVAAERHVISQLTAEQRALTNVIYQGKLIAREALVTAFNQLSTQSRNTATS